MATTYKGITRREVLCALETIMDECSPERGFEGYAMSYAVVAIEHAMSDRELHCQVLYILGNLQTWRGARARECKKILRSYHVE
jgi:hypothetical protein